jgi:putative transposase
VAKNPTDRFESKYLNIKSFVEKVIKDNSAYGIKRIKKELEEKYQITIGRDTLGKLLKLWGLSLSRKIKKKKPNMIAKILIALADRANLLIRTRVDKPLQAVTSDITKLKFRGGTAYLCIHKDSFGQMVYGWSLSLTMETPLVMKSLKMARFKIKKLIKKFSFRLAKRLIFHQDRGSQYTSYQYITAVLRFAILSFSKPGSPTDNPGQESFFGRFKDEWGDEIAEIKTFETLQEFVKQKIKYYNYERRHTSIGLISPYQFSKSFFKNRCF